MFSFIDILNLIRTFIRNPINIYRAMRINMQFRHLIIAALLVVPAAASAQQRDSLPPAYKSAYVRKVPAAGNYTISRDAFKVTVSPTGEADIIKYIQTLPGVASGADGTGAMYTRGGNAGNNLISIDGVPVWGGGHLLGLTTAFPAGIIDRSEFYVGGFDSEDWNVSSSILKMKTPDGDFDTIKSSFSVSNFLLGGQVEAPVIKDKLSIIAAARISPLSLEYKMLRPIIDRSQDFVNDFSCSVYDVYAKATYRIDPKNTASLFAFHSGDSYSFQLGQNDKDALAWNNVIVNGAWDRQLPEDFKMRVNLSYNHFGNRQSQQVGTTGGTDTQSSVFGLNEVTGGVQFFKSATERRSVKFGARVKFGTFGQTGSQNDGILHAAINGQVEWKEKDKYVCRIAGRANLCVAQLLRAPQIMADPDISFLWRKNFGRTTGMELTLDCVTQYHHNLEGVPMGWSIDMIVPSDRYNKPEHTMQGYLGLFGDYGNHHVTLGGYYKYMKNLVYYKDAASFFNSLRSGWKDNIELGVGTSYGAEFMYEKIGEILSWKASYTWSKTDRTFPSVNKGEIFPAKFDRRHIGNFTLSWKFYDNRKIDLSYVTLFTYQSGNWETARDGKMPLWMQFTEGIAGSAPMISSVNNFQMPALIRWDNSLQMNINSGRMRHEINLGIYNTLNRHNAAFLYYNSQKQRWETMALIPFMPTVSYRISF